VACDYSADNDQEEQEKGEEGKPTAKMQVGVKKNEPDREKAEDVVPAPRPCLWLPFLFPETA
jgi:hypothetical protein